MEIWFFCGIKMINGSLTSCNVLKMAIMLQGKVCVWEKVREMSFLSGVEKEIHGQQSLFLACIEAGIWTMTDVNIVCCCCHCSTRCGLCICYLVFSLVKSGLLWLFLWSLFLIRLLIMCNSWNKDIKENAENFLHTWWIECHENEFKS